MDVRRTINALKDVNIAKMFTTIARLLHFRLTWTRRDLDYLPAGLGPKFVSARRAAAMIPDGATLTIGGFAATGRASIFYWALRDAFDRSGHPRNLTVIGACPQGGRGKTPGMIEELDAPGIITRYIVGHGETAKALLQLADDGQLELHTMSQGALAFLIEAQARGLASIQTSVGLDTFLDPAVGCGSAVSPGAPNNFITAKNGKLEYRIPPIDRALFLAPYADKDGNIYFKDAALILDYKDAAAAARLNGGKVIVSVSKIIPRDNSQIAIPADNVDAIVVNPRNEQVGGILQTQFMPHFTAGSSEVDHEAVKLMRLINTFLDITPYRGKVVDILARLCADTFVKTTGPGAIVNIGIGIGEEVARMLYESGLYRDITFTSEGGAYGGLPASGVYFGAAISPQRILSTAEIFHIYEERLDTCVLGFLQVDSAGNVNVSHRGPKIIDFVGPGGFTDIVEYARTIIFVGNWMDEARYGLKNGLVRVKKPGVPKFVDKVDQITFNARKALKAGRKVLYVTTVGVFKLTEEGLELVQIMPGINIEKDILQNSTARFIIPGSPIPEVAPEIVSGKRFELKFDKKDLA
ncbi:MAG TPA: CoA-transferase [Smithella sp.]|nr:CoA-transferase [Smithella sp.]HPK22540.1 CoA-transferase [Smithella sp.]HPX30429.1 CoA-transferase [Smithella sp.]HQC18579.1 CoA-transferase [Smithella sp.]HQP40646.1 CoA-transferase [Smithella sp.]